MKLLYEGKAKKLYETDDASDLLKQFKNGTTAFDRKKKAQFEGSGRLNEASSLTTSLTPCAKESRRSATLG